MTSVVRFSFWPALVCVSVFAVSASAQPVRLRGSPLLEQSEAVEPVGGRTADYIVALVNSEPVTNNEVRLRMMRVQYEMAQQGLAIPPREELARQVMELLVSERAQLQAAAEQGIRVDEVSLDQAEQVIAMQNQLSLEEFRRRVTEQGTSRAQFRHELRDQLLLRKVHDREVERVRVSNSEIEDRTQELNASSTERRESNLSHVLFKVPESASDAEVRVIQLKAQSVADRARAGENFAVLAREFSEAAEGASGGSFGWRAASKLPALFVQSTSDLPAGGVAGPVRSPVGWHVLKVEGRRAGVAPELMLVQTHVSHLLLRPSSEMSQEVAVARLAGWREQIVKGQAKFESLAREFSQDGSAVKGGDLGWVKSGQFVPEFEAVMSVLQPGELSQPTISRFGVHLIRLNGRREVAMTPEQQREAVRNMLREKKVEENLQTWAQDVRGQTYVEFRSAPSP